MNTKKRNIIAVIILVIFLLLLFSPWMTDNWCRNRLTGFEFGGYRAIDDSWIINANWIPFGRNVDAWLPEDEQPKTPEGAEIPIIGGYGFSVLMSPFGINYGVFGH